VVAHFSESQRGERGALYASSSSDTSGFQLDDGGSVSLGSLRDRRDPITFTAVPPGEGRRSGIDRDLDGVLDALQR
jgi:hypothetical protein